MDSNLIIYKNDDKGMVVIINKDNNSAIGISNEVFEIIKDINSIEDLKNIASQYCDEDKDYFEVLIKNMQEKRILEINKSFEGIRRVYYAITNCCNLKCTHCCYSAGYINSYQNYEVNPDIIKNIIKLNPKQICISGGEPLTVSNLKDIIHILHKEYNGVITLASNGTLINEENVDELCEIFSNFDISLDGIDEETTAKLRGKGVYEKVINAVALLKKHNVSNIILSMVVDNTTRIYRDKFIELCEQLQVEPLIRTMNLVGRAKDTQEDSSDIVQFMNGSTSNIIGCYDCPGGTREIFVNFKGDIYPCAMFEEEKFKIGNILDNKWINTLKWDKDFPWFKEFSEYIPDTREECNDCDVKSLCWNCPSLAKAYLDNNKLGSFKGLCDTKHKRLQEVLWNE